MQLDDILKTARGNHLRVMSIDEDDRVICRHMEAQVTLPPVNRTVLENQTENISAHCWDRTITDFEVEIGSIQIAG